MNKPSNYEQTTTGDYTPVALGGHTAIIKKVEETTSKTGKPMIKVAIDFDASDSQPNYFMESFKNDIRPDKKWPFQGTQYILSEDNEGNCSKSFKSFITSIERSNEGFTVGWGKTFAAQFANKKVGVVFGEVEEEYNGEVKVRRRIRYFCDYTRAKGASIPDRKNLPTSGANTSTAQSDLDGFVNVKDDGDIPF